MSLATRLDGWCFRFPWCAASTILVSLTVQSVVTAGEEVRMSVLLFYFLSTSKRAQDVLYSIVYLNSKNGGRASRQTCMYVCMQILTVLYVIISICTYWYVHTKGQIFASINAAFLSPTTYSSKSGRRNKLHQRYCKHLKSQCSVACSIVCENMVVEVDTYLPRPILGILEYSVLAGKRKQRTYSLAVSATAPNVKPRRLWRDPCWNNNTVHR